MLELQFPIHEALVYLYPVLGRGRIVDLHGYAPHVLLVVGIGGLSDDISLVDILLEGEQYLIGVDGFDEVVGNLRSDSLVHDVLLLALGDHDYGYGWAHLLDEGQRLQPREARHVLVEQDEVVALLSQTIEGIASIGRGVNIVVLPL